MRGITCVPVIFHPPNLAFPSYFGNFPSPNKAKSEIFQPHPVSIDGHLDLFCDLNFVWQSVLLCMISNITGLAM